MWYYDDYAGLDSRLNPLTSVNINGTVVNTGDRAKLLWFNDDAPDALSILGSGDSRAALREIAATGDDRNGDGYVDDGQSRSRLDLFDANGDAADDVFALVEAAADASNAAFDLHVHSSHELCVTIHGEWSDDILCLRDTLGVAAVLHAAGLGFRVGNRKDEVLVHDFGATDDANDAVRTGGSRRLDDNDVGALFKGGKLNEHEVDEIVFAALGERDGADAYDDLHYYNLQFGDEITFGVTNTRGATDTFVISGDVVAQAVADYEAAGFVFV